MSRSIITSLAFLCLLEPVCAEENGFLSQIEKVFDGTLGLVTRNKFGSGFVIDSRGFVITNRHVVANGGPVIAQTNDGSEYFGRVIGRGVHSNHDLALVKIEADKPLKPLVLGRSDKVSQGDELVVLGNPGNRLHRISRGTVNRIETDDEGRGWKIYTDAPILGGTSGGPIFNPSREVVGVAKGNLPNNVHIGLTVDELRRAIPEIVAAEIRYEFKLGMTVDTLNSVATVTAVQPESPADASGLQVGDVVLRMGTESVTDGIDFYLSLIGRQAGEKLTMLMQRGDEQVPVYVTLGEYPIAVPEVIDKEKLLAGLDIYLIQGEWEKIPPIESLDPSGHVVSDVIALPEELKREDNFAAAIFGFLEIRDPGLYTFGLTSDGGSRLQIGDRVLLDNDGLHEEREVNQRIRLSAGMHPITILYFEREAAGKLDVRFRRAEGPTTTIPAADLFRLKK